MLSDFAAATKDFDDAIQLDPKDENAYFNRANAKARLNNYAGAILDYDDAIRIEPKNPTSYLNRGNAKFSLRDYSGVIKDLATVIELDPANSYAYWLRGSAYLGLKDYANAIWDYDKCIQLGTDEQEIAHSKYCKSLILSTAEDAKYRNPKQAMQLAEEILKVDLQNPNLLHAKSCAMAAKGDYAVAIGLQKSISDGEWLSDTLSDGGALSQERIAAWKAGKLWHPK